jgi:hypothetical protein
MQKIPFQLGFQIGEIVEVISCAVVCDDTGEDVPVSPGQLLIVASRIGTVSYRFVVRTNATIGYTLPRDVAHNVMQLARPDAPLNKHTQVHEHFAPMYNQMPLTRNMTVQPEWALTQGERDLGRRIVEQFTSRDQYRKH